MHTKTDLTAQFFMLRYGSVCFLAEWAIAILEVDHYNLVLCQWINETTFFLDWVGGGLGLGAGASPLTKNEGVWERT